jgi:hypothetical protein
MKKTLGRRLIALFMLGSSFSLPSCSKGVGIDIGSKILTKKSETVDSYVMIQDLAELNSLARYDDAVILVTLPGCQHCLETIEEMKTYIPKTHNLVYAVNFFLYDEAYSAQDNQTGTYARLYPKIESTPSFLFYRRGTLKNLWAKKDSETVEAVLPKYLYDYPYYAVNDFTKTEYGYYYEDISEDYDTTGFGTAALDQLLATETRKTVLYTWRRCGDCRNYHDYVLDPFFVKNPTAKIYFYEVDGYYLLKRSAEETAKTEGLKRWSAFTVKYFLHDYDVSDAEGNPTGYVPTAVTYRKTGHETDVYANDLDPLRNSDGTLSYGKAFHSEVLALKSASAVSEGDTTSSAYQNALKELGAKAMDLENTLSSDYLTRNLL